MRCSLATLFTLVAVLLHAELLKPVAAAPEPPALLDTRVGITSTTRGYYTPVWGHGPRDAHTACACIATVMQGSPCAHYVRYATGVCLAYAPAFHQTLGCLSLCCSACPTYGAGWPACEDERVTALCDTLSDDAIPLNEELDGPEIAKTTPEAEHSTTPEAEHSTTPEAELSASPEVEQSASPEVEEGASLDVEDDASPEASPEETIVESAEPSLEAELFAEESSSPEAFATDEEAEETASETPLASPMLSTFEEDGPVMPGELDLSPSFDRPFGPAACECMVAGTECSTELAASSGVCTEGIEAMMQPMDCVFNCCRICVANMDISYCEVEEIRSACGF